MACGGLSRLAPQAPGFQQPLPCREGAVGFSGSQSRGWLHLLILDSPRLQRSGPPMSAGRYEQVNVAGLMLVWSSLPAYQPTMSKRVRQLPQDRGFILFDVVFEDGSRASNRRVPMEILGGLDGDEPARGLIEQHPRGTATMRFKSNTSVLACCAAALILLSVDTSQARELRIDQRLLAYRSLNGKSVAEVLRAVQIGKEYKFAVQSLNEIPPSDDGQSRVVICYWLGDVQHIEQEATCGIRFSLDTSADKWIADPVTRDLSDPLLSGENAFDLALEIKFKAVCGIDRERSKREC